MKQTGKTLNNSRTVMMPSEDEKREDNLGGLEGCKYSLCGDNTDHNRDGDGVESAPELEGRCSILV